jgi:hypothetical protein
MPTRDREYTNSHVLFAEPDDMLAGMSTTNEDDCRAFLSLIRGAARTPLLGMTTDEIQAITRLNASRVKSCVESLLSRDLIISMGKREGQDVYRIKLDDV